MTQLHFFTRVKLHFGLNPFFTTLSDTEFNAKHAAVARALDKLIEHHCEAWLDIERKNDIVSLRNHYDAMLKYQYFKRSIL